MATLDHAGASDDRAQGISERAAAVLKIFDAKRTEMEKASSPAAWREARRRRPSLTRPGHAHCRQGPVYRDEMMAKNVEWLADEAYPNEKIVLWAHNGHVRFGSQVGGRAWVRG